MDFIKSSYQALKNMNYFEKNINLQFSTVNKQHRRYLEDFLCNAGTSLDSFKASYARLQSRLSGDVEFLHSFFYLYKELYTSNITREGSPEVNCYFYISALLFRLFIKDSKFTCKDISVQNEFTESIEVLFNPRLNEANTIKQILRILKLSSVDNGVPLNLHILTQSGDSKVFNFQMRVIVVYLHFYITLLTDPALFRTEDMTRSFSKALYQFNAVIPRLSSSLKVEYKRIMNKKGILSDLIYTNKLGVLNQIIPFYYIYSLPLNAMQEILEDTLTRTGYLKPEYRFGTVFKCLPDKERSLYEKDLSSNLSEGIPLQYNIREILSEDGINVFYFIYNDDFLITVEEDYSVNRVVAQMVFMDVLNSFNTDETMKGVLVDFYMQVRERYKSFISDPNKTVSDIEIENVIFKSDATTDSEEYIYKKRFIAPYKRKLPSGQKPTSDKRDLAAKFNIQLEPDEVFVNSFLRKQRYKKDTLLPTEDDMSVIKSFNYC